MLPLAVARQKLIGPPSLAPQQALYDPGDLDSFAQVLFHRLVMEDPAGMLDTLALAGDNDRQAVLATELGRSQAPSVESVLEAIGIYHPVRAVAKAARKALFLRRSRAAARHSNGVRLPGSRGGLPVSNRRRPASPGPSAGRWTMPPRRRPRGQAAHRITPPAICQPQCPASARSSGRSVRHLDGGRGR